MRVEIENLRKSYNGIVVLDIERLALPGSGIIAVVGPNGAGKSTLLNLIGDLTAKDEGVILYDGEPVVPRKKLTLVFQEPYLISASVRENIGYPLKLRKVPGQIIEKRVWELARGLKLEALLSKRAGQLSLGETQKVALARALSFWPDLLMLDEPCASIDVYATSEIERILVKMKQEKQMTIVIVTHNLVQARRLADYVVLLNKGKVVECGGAEQFFGAPSKEETRKFLQGELLM